MGICGVLLNKVDILRAAENNAGIVKYVAECLDCTRDTIYNWMKRDPEVAAAFATARELHDLHTKELDYLAVEKSYEALMDLIEQRHPGIVMFTLERRGRWIKEDKPVSQAQTLVYQVNNGSILHDKSSNPISVSSTPIPAKDIDSVT